MSLYDTCSAKEITAKSIISSIMDENCIASYNLGNVFSPQYANIKVSKTNIWLQWNIFVTKV